MSYFSDTSSTFSAPPLTPSPRHASSSIHHHGMPAGLSHALSSPSLSTFGGEGTESPPERIRQYSSALKVKMSAGLTAAMRDLKDDRGGPERKFDAEYGYDEDPIERHVRLFLTPRKVPENSKAMPELGLLPATAPPAGYMDHRAAQVVRAERLVPSTAPRPLARSAPLTRTESDQEGHMLAPAPASHDDLGGAAEIDGMPARFRPGLIHFHRSNSSSLGAPRPPFSRMGSDVSTGSNTSMMSEASFEAVRAEDIISMYGSSGTPAGPSTSSASMGRRGSLLSREDPFGLELDEECDMARASMMSTETETTVQAAGSPERRHESAFAPQDSLNEFPQPSQYTFGTPAVPPPLSQRPSLLRKRSRPHPYDKDPLAMTPVGSSHGADASAYAASRRTPGSTLASPLLDDVEPAWLKNRTTSETMVAMAGLRCQRQRAGVRGTRS
ncbi:hypothetical protein IAU60_000051 [Kwoniella sp. DSM 27419]